MPIGISERKYQSETRGVDQSLLQACIGEKIKVITSLYFDQIYMASELNDRRVIFNPSSERTGIYYNEDVAWFEDAYFLNQCQVGDEFIAGGAGAPAGTFKLIEIISPNVGRCETVFTNVTLEDEGEYVANTTALKSLIYQYGINSSTEFVSGTDGSLQKLTIDSSSALTDVVSQALIANGYKDWQIDSVTLVGDGDDAVNYPANTHVRITLTHEIVITPLYLQGQYENMRLGLPPEYFKPDNAIKYFAQIDWNKNNSLLDSNKSIQLEPVGQFGWFGTKYNGLPSSYSISNLVIKRVSDDEVVDRLQCQEMDVKFRITSSGNNFDSSDTALIFGFNYLPEDTSLYQQTDRFLQTNFAFDSKRFLPD